jgi:exopolysaccharide production protein ExoQ
VSEPFPEENPGTPWLARAEAATCFVILALMSGALLAPLFAPDQNPDAAPFLRQMWLPVYGCIAVMMLIKPIEMTRMVVPGLMGLVLVGWAAASYRWSIAPDLTLRRSVALLFTTAFGLYMAARYDWRDLIRMFAAVFLLLAVGTYIASLLFPSFGVHATIHPGAWKGLWYEKNQMGGLMVLGTLACACAAIVQPEERRLWIVAAVLNAGLVITSTSTTALLGLVITCAGLIGLAMLRRGGAVTVFTLWAAAAGAAAFVALILLAPEAFFALVGKDATLTGRTGIWEALFRRVAERPVLGYGFGAFWQNPWGPAWFIKHEVQWSAPNAHNGWLDILVQLGWVGLILAVAHFVISAVVAVAKVGRGSEAYWTVTFTVLFALFSISESTVMQYNNISWVMYTATMAKLFEWRGLASGPVPRAASVRLFPDEEPEGMWGRPVR